MIIFIDYFQRAIKIHAAMVMIYFNLVTIMRIELTLISR